MGFSKDDSEKGQSLSGFFDVYGCSHVVFACGVFSFVVAVFFDF